MRTPHALIIATSLLLMACGQSDLLPAASAQASDEARQCADEQAVLVPGTGDYGRGIDSASPEAQAFFDQGLRLTYSFYFPEALASFNAALCFDPDNPMIHWGRALAIGPNPNSRYGNAQDDPAGLGLEAIEEARAGASELPAVDRALIEALGVLLDKEGYADRAARSEAFIETTRELLAEYPEDPEVAFLAADAIMMASPWQYFAEDGSPIGLGGEALRILEEGMDDYPEHPGLNHLHIHLLENSGEPGRAEVSADRLESLTPKAGHMVHMPGHIYMRVGRYDDAVATNERSLEADKYFVEQWGDRPLPGGLTYGLSARSHGGHARNFIQWASLLQGNSERAIDLARRMAAGIPEERLNRGGSLRTPATYYMTLRAFGRWDEILDEELPPASQPYLRGILHWARGGASIARGDLEAAEAELKALQAVAEDQRLARQRATVNSTQDLLTIAEATLRGELASAREQWPRAIEAFEEAVEVQDGLRYMEPPDWMHSSRLYLGQAYLEAGQPAEAEGVFRDDLEDLQENGWALFGLAASLAAQGRGEEAEAVRERFRAAWDDADIELSAARF